MSCCVVTRTVRSASMVGRAFAASRPLSVPMPSPEFGCTRSAPPASAALHRQRQPCAHTRPYRGGGRLTAVRVAAMRAVLQRVKSASVEVDGAVVSRIGQGWLCLVGLTNDDTPADADYVVKKILKTKGWPDPEANSPWAKDVAAIEGEILCVSQFTLYARLKKPKPDYSRAMGPDQAREAYAAFLGKVRAAYAPERVKDGVFGAMMDVQLQNDGPVTFIVDSGHQGAGQH